MRRERTQIIRHAVQPADIRSGLEQVRQILHGAAGLATSAVNAEAQNKRAQQQYQETRDRLARTQQNLQFNIERQGLQNDLEDARFQRRTLAEEQMMIEKETAELRELELGGAMALLSRLSDEDLPAGAKALGVTHPDNISDINHALGERMASRDYQVLLRQFLTDTGKSPQQHLEQWFEGHMPEGDEQAVAYAGLLTRLVRQDEERSLRERIAAGKQVGAENALFKLERDVVLSRRDFMAQPKDLEERLKAFHAESLRYDPTVSEADVASIFAQRIMPRLTSEMSGLEQAEFMKLLEGANQKSPYLRDISSTTIDGLRRDTVAKVNQQRAAVKEDLAAQIEGARQFASLNSLQQAVADGKASGLLDDAGFNELADLLAKQEREIEKRTKIEAKLAGDSSMAHLPILAEDQQTYETMLRERAADYESERGERMPFDQSLRLQLRAGALSNDTIEGIRSLIEAPVADGDTSALVQGIEALRTIKTTAPNLYRERFIEKERGALSGPMQAAVTLVDTGADATEVARLVAQIDDERWSEAEASLRNVDVGRRARIASSERLWIGNVFTTPHPGGTSNRAMDMYEALYKVHFASQRFGDEEAKAEKAHKKATKEIGDRFDTIGIDGRLYMVDTTLKIAARRGDEDLMFSLADADNPGKDNIKNKYRKVLTHAADHVAFYTQKQDTIRPFDTRTSAGIFEPFLDAGSLDYTFDLDNARFEGTDIVTPVLGPTGQPLVNDAQQPLEIRYPVSLQQQHKLTNLQAFAREQVLEWIGKDNPAEQARLEREERDRRVLRFLQRGDS